MGFGDFQSVAIYMFREQIVLIISFGLVPKMVLKQIGVKRTNNMLGRSSWKSSLWLTTVASLFLLEKYVPGGLLEPLPGDISCSL